MFWEEELEARQKEMEAKAEEVARKSNLNSTTVGSTHSRKLLPHSRTAAQVVSDLVFLDNADIDVDADVMERIEDDEGNGAAGDEDGSGDGDVDSGDGAGSGMAKAPMLKRNHPRRIGAEFRASGKSRNEMRQLATQAKQAIKTKESEIKPFRKV
ncbi:hypothetical protein BGZ65_006322, partial [Modicella reniformis]